ncbi:replication protein [Haloarcula sp. AONF1]
MGRPAAVRQRQKLREDCVYYEGSDADAATNVRSKSMKQIVRSFLEWYNDYRFAHLRFNDPDGNLVRAPLRNSHQPEYGNKYYARFKALERRMCMEYDNPQTAMLTLSGSSKNRNGHWRCIVDHLRDVIDSWRPERGRGVYHSLREALDVDAVSEWEYAIAVEHHKSGYGHVHVGIFADGELNEKMFRPVIDKHLEVCDIAHRDGHDYYHPDPEKRPISVNPLADNVEDGVNNMASYLAAYIGASDGSELFDRAPEEILFRAAAWSSTTQRVRFSTGANEMIRRDAEAQGYNHGSGVRDAVSEIGGSWKPGTTKEKLQDAAADPDRSPAEYLESVGDGGSWSLEGVGRVDNEGETVFEVENKTVKYLEIDGAESLDPPVRYGPERPKRKKPDAKPGPSGGVAGD